MHVEILYFAAVRELVGFGTERRELPGDVRTIAELAAHLESVHPGLKGRLASVRFARNEVFVVSAEALADGDVVALIPPVAGG